MFFKIDVNRLNRDKGFICRCLIKSDENKKSENICPCDEFTTKLKCRCNMFNYLGDFCFLERLKMAYKIIFGGKE